MLDDFLWNTFPRQTCAQEGSMNKKDPIIFAITAVIGLAVWVDITGISGKAEAWDSPLFFRISLPVMLMK